MQYSNTFEQQQQQHAEINTLKWRIKDRMGHKNGSHSTVFLVNGDRYIGEWKHDLKEGII